MIATAAKHCFLCFLIVAHVETITSGLVSAWTLKPQQRDVAGTPSKSTTVTVTRRSILQTISTATAVSLLGLTQAPSTTLAASSSVPTPDDLKRIQKGHARVAYLLKNWDSITQVCGTNVMSDSERKQVVRTEGGGGTTGCEKTPLNVQQLRTF